MSNMIAGTEWRKLGVKRERSHEPLVDKLCSSREAGKAIFTYIKDLMIFAAMVGRSLEKRRPISGESVSIILETYASDQKDAFIYLIALMEDKNATVLKDENLTQAIRVFEEYCNAGLYEIKLWLDENPGDPEGVDTLVEKILEKAIQNEASERAEVLPEDIEVSF